jgi:hypothetical protein
MTESGRLGLFQMVVRNRPVLIYAGRSERDVDRYAIMEAGRCVYKFQGDVLAATTSDMYLTGATAAQALLWRSAFKVAVAAGEVGSDNPAAFALAVNS